MPLESDVDRPVVHRLTVRVLLVESGGHILLIEDSDPGAPGAPRFWMPPGGGVDPGETLLVAASREVEEETGLRVAPQTLRGPVAERTVVRGFSDKISVQSETYFVAGVPRQDAKPTGLTDSERSTFVGYRWWSLDELRQADRPVWPVGLADLVAVADAPASWPVPLSVAEESTVPTNHTHR